MPGLSGWDVQKRLAAAGSRRQIIIITADKNGGLQERALEAGAVGFLQKPFNDQALVDLIKVAVRVRALIERIFLGEDSQYQACHFIPFNAISWILYPSTKVACPLYLS